MSNIDKATLVSISKLLSPFNDGSILNVTIQLRAIGLSILPVALKGKRPALKSWLEYQNRVPTEKEINNWFAGKVLNYAIVCGKVSGFVVVDFDTAETILWGIENLPVPVFKCKTANGQHWYYRYPIVVNRISNSVGLWIQGKKYEMDIRADGGYVIGPGSSHETGFRYELMLDQEYNSDSYYDPMWFSGNNHSYEPLANEPGPSTQVLAQKYIERQPPAVAGNGGDHQTYSICCKLIYSYGLNFDESLALLIEWNKTCAPPWTIKELKDKIQNAITYGRGSIGLDKADQWEDIVPFDENRLPEFPYNIFPEQLELYLNEVAASSETPRDLVMMLALAALSTAAKGSYRIKGCNGYAEPCPLWVTVILEPGARKSYVANTIFAPIYQYEKHLTEISKQEINKVNFKIKNHEAQVNSMRKKIGKEGQDTKKLLSQIEELEASKPKKKFLPRLVVTDITPESLAVKMSENEEVISLLSDEGGFFETMGGRYNNGKSNFDLYLQSYSESPVRVDRVRAEEPVQMNNPIITIGATVQPGVLSALSSRPEFKNLGLLSRFIYSVPTSTIGFRKWENRVISPELTEFYQLLIKKILDYTTFGGEF